MDGPILSRLETEWLVAWFYGRSRQMPPSVQERLQSVGFMDGVTLTAVGRRWLQTRGPERPVEAKTDPAARAEALVEFEAPLRLRGHVGNA